MHQDPRIQKWSAPRFFHGMTTDEMDSNKDIHTIMRLLFLGKLIMRLIQMEASEELSSPFLPMLI